MRSPSPLAGINALRGLILSSLLIPTLALNGDSFCRHAACVSAIVENDVVTYEMTGLQMTDGWMAIGWGERMVNTHSVIMWKNQDGSISMSQRYAPGYRQPILVDDPPRVAKLVEPRKTVTRPPHSLTFAFQVPVNHTLLRSQDASEKMIFATSTITPTSKDADANIPRHEHVGYFTLDLTKQFNDVTTKPVSSTHGQDDNKAPAQPQYTTGPLKKVEKIMILHGALVAFGFLVLLPAGSLIGRYARVITPNKWFRMHRLSNGVIALPVITLGVLLGPLVVYNKETFRKHFANPHEVCGILLLFMYFAQISLGQYIHNRRLQIAKLGPVTKPHPPLNILHIVLGISIIALSFFQVRSGLQWWETLTGRGPLTGWAHPLWKTWIIILPLAYFGGYILLPRQLHQEREAAYAPLARDTTDDSARLLDEEGH